jgi:hypothetical protein
VNGRPPELIDSIAGAYMHTLGGGPGVVIRIPPGGSYVEIREEGIGEPRSLKVLRPLHAAAVEMLLATMPPGERMDVGQPIDPRILEAVGAFT